MNSAKTSTTAVVMPVCVAKTAMGCAAFCHPETPNIHWLINAPDSIPQITNTRLLPTSMEAMNNCGLFDKAATTLPLREDCAFSSVCSLLEATKAISIPEKKAEAKRERARMTIKLEGSGSMHAVSVHRKIRRKLIEAVPCARERHDELHTTTKRCRGRDQGSNGSCLRSTTGRVRNLW